MKYFNTPATKVINYSSIKRQWPYIEQQSEIAISIIIFQLFPIEAMKKPAYLTFANKINHMIDEGIYKAEEKLPSLRSIHKENELSTGTILRAFNHLIHKGKISSKEKSGYFVSYSFDKLFISRS